MGSKIITARMVVDPTAGLGSFVVPLLGDPGEKRAYRLLSFGASGLITGSSGADGCIVALQDGDIEPGILSTAESGRAQRFATADGMYEQDLSITWSLGLSASGGGQSGFTSQQKEWWPGFVTANPQLLILTVRSISAKRIMAHLEYEQIAVSPMDWAELKHRATVVDLVFPVDS